MPFDKTGEIHLAEHHGWKAKPGHQILVLDRGAARLDYPAGWVVRADDDCLKVYDKEPPDDDCVLGVSYHRWPRVPPPGPPVAELVRRAFDDDPRSLTARDAVVEETRGDLEIAWGEGRFVDEVTCRDACGRLCLAREEGIQALLTYDFWLDDRERCHAVWQGVLASLEIARWIDDPAVGPLVS